MAAKPSKRTALIREKVENKLYEIAEAYALLQDLPALKFVQSVDVSVNLGVDPRKSDQVVRGATVLPSGSGKTVRVVVFAQGEQAEQARDAGADRVGFEDLADSIKDGSGMDFDVAIATPESMRLVGQLGQILGPRGLMPNPKVGTVTADVADAVKMAKAGQVRYRTDKAGIIHCSVGQLDFALDAIKTNLEALLSDLKKAKPSSAKGVYIKKITLSTTMGPGLSIDMASLNV